MTGLTCREMTDFLADYLDGTLALAERRLFEKHLAGCPDCITYLRSYAETIRLARETQEADTLPDGVPEDLVRAILAARCETKGAT
jgi:predicted anti-sigma-YlaC factor YlaD